MKQTAVEWLYKLSKKRELDKFDLQQAKEMEKEQIRRAFCHGEVARDRIDSMEYYNETYGK
jgi:hypothetical protein